MCYRVGASKPFTLYPNPLVSPHIRIQVTHKVTFLKGFLWVKTQQSNNGIAAIAEKVKIESHL